MSTTGPVAERGAGAEATAEAGVGAGAGADAEQAILEQEAAQRGFSRSVVISGIRCTLTYVILPFVAPFIGLAPNVGPVIGLIVGSVAIAANLFSIRRFWAADHRWKAHATVLHCAVLLLLVVLMVLDIRDLVG